MPSAVSRPPSAASIARIWRRVTPTWRSMPNSLRARQRLRGEGRGDAEQADHDRDRFQQIGDGEAAVEDASG